MNQDHTPVTHDITSGLAHLTSTLERCMGDVIAEARGLLRTPGLSETDSNTLLAVISDLHAIKARLDGARERRKASD